MQTQLLFFSGNFSVKYEQKTILKHRRGIEHYLEGGHESGILDLDGRSDEEMEESVSPSPSTTEETEDEGSADDESDSMSAENDHGQPGYDEGEKHQAAKRSASEISEESETFGVEDKNAEINKQNLGSMYHRGANFTSKYEIHTSQVVDLLDLQTIEILEHLLHIQIILER